MQSIIEMHEEEIVAPEPFKFNPEPSPDQPDLEEVGKQEEQGQDEGGYTPGETEYADGQGTQLDQEINSSEDDDEQDEDAKNSALGHA